MTCSVCRSENLPSARFCAACGARVIEPGAMVPRPPPTPTPLEPRAFGQVAALYVCPHCGLPMRPVAYFSRGVNIAKAMVLMMPLSFLGPLMLFFLRKDRLICGRCKRLLPGEVAMPLLQSFSGAGQGTQALGAPVPVGALAAYDPEQDLAVIEHRRRTSRARAWSWGVLGAGFAGLGLATGASGNFQGALAFLTMATPPAIGAAIYAVRTRMLGRVATARRARERRARVLALARAQRGRLTVSVVAAELRLELSEAEDLLGGMVDGQRVEMEVDDAGRISYVFTELVES